MMIFLTGKIRRILQSTDLRCCAANPIAQRMKLYVSRYDSCAPSTSALLNSHESSVDELLIKANHKYSPGYFT